jgi:hypothetical protein
MLEMTQTGISNRLPKDDEERDRQEHPRQPTGSPLPEDAAGRKGDASEEIVGGGQTSHKAGSRSVSQKEAESKYADRSHPASRKVAGASGAEPGADDSEEPSS